MLSEKTKEGYEVKTKQWMKIMKKDDHETTINFALGNVSTTYKVNLTGELILNGLYALVSSL